MTEKSFYITTPIYYPSDKLHIGHCYTTVAADAMARFKRLKGYDVWFLTGTDEHGQKIERRASEAGKSSQVFVDEIVEWIKELWDILDISYDDFIRTTEKRHKQSVQAIFNQLYEQGDIYKDKYEGLYCTPCEAFWTERQVKEGCCPDCGSEVEMVSEESYFFKMSKYADRLYKYILDNEEFIQPPSRKNEMINNFLKPGLEELCVSRTSFDWGIEVPFDKKHVVYVWLDALSNYITALGYPQDMDKVNRYWPADVQLIGKEIVRFHTIYWPIFLMALGLPLPKQVFGHGWLLLQEGKMSKSKGNVIDPTVLVDQYGSDAIRYFLLREIPFGADGVFSSEALIQRINSDLANDLGNLIHRTLNMVNKFAGGIIEAPTLEGEYDGELRELALETSGEMEKLIEKLQFSNALAVLWKLVGRANKYIDETEPWALNREGKKERLNTVLYNYMETIRIISVLLHPFMPKTPLRIWELIGISHESEQQTWDSAKTWGLYKAGTRVKESEVLFPRIELEKDEDYKTVKKDRKNGQKKVEGKTVEPSKTSAQGKTESASQIKIDDFARVDLRVAEILQAEKVPGADKLLKVQVSLGKEQRQIVAGIAQHYKPEEIVGKRVLFVANLAPVKIRGIESQGMLLAAVDADGKLVLSSTDVDIAPGSRVS